jgi:hypothetical protein
MAFLDEEGDVIQPFPGGWMGFRRNGPPIVGLAYVLGGLALDPDGFGRYITSKTAADNPPDSIAIFSTDKAGNETAKAATPVNVWAPTGAASGQIEDRGGPWMGAIRLEKCESLLGYSVLFR